MAPRFEGVDYYDVSSLLTEEERAVRDTVRQWVDDRLLPVINEHYLAGKFPRQLVPEMAELGFFGANLPEEYGCAGPQQRRLRPDHAGAGARRLRPALLRLRAGRAGHVPHPRLRLRGPAEEVAARDWPPAR